MDVSKLTMGEVAQVESLSGLSINEVGDETKPKGLALAALAYVAKKRTNPEFTWNDAQALTMADVQDVLGETEEPEAGPKAKRS